MEAKLLFAATLCSVHSRGQGMYLGNGQRLPAKIQAMCMEYICFVCLANRREFFLTRWMLHTLASCSRSLYP